jgi:hypothetical protein
LYLRYYCWQRTDNPGYYQHLLIKFPLGPGVSGHEIPTGVHECGDKDDCNDGLAHNQIITDALFGSFRLTTLTSNAIMKIQDYSLFKHQINYRKENQMDPRSKPFITIVGVSIYFGLIVGLAGMILAVIAIFSSEWLAAGVFFIASAIAFGLLANALLRK